MKSINALDKFSNSCEKTNKQTNFLLMKSLPFYFWNWNFIGATGSGEFSS